MKPAHPDPVARYYDQNTARFLRFGGSGATAALHRQIWAPGVQDAAQAFLYLNRLVSSAITPLFEPAALNRHLLDLGCGVGGTATWLAQHHAFQVVGITNSPVQARLAVERARRLGLQDACRFIEADFHALPGIGEFQAAYAIESFAHARDPGCFFQQVAARLVRGGRLVVCDDFLATEPVATGKPLTRTTSQAVKWVGRFQAGWQLSSLLPVELVSQLATAASLVLVAAHDLTAYVRLPRLAVLEIKKTLTRLPLRGAYWRNLVGGTALQTCIRQGWTQYQALVWQKS